MDLLKRIGKGLGLTKEKAIELSDLIETDATVTTRHIPSFSAPSWGRSGFMMPGPHYIPDRYLVTFSDGNASFTFESRDWYETFQERRDVRMRYREIIEIVRDYDDDLSAKKEVGRRNAGYQFAGISSKP